MAIRFKDYAQGVLATSISGSATSFNLQTGQGARFPVIDGASNPNSDHFYVTMQDALNNRELIKVIHRPSGSDQFGNATYPIVRDVDGYNGGIGRAWSAGDQAYISLPAWVLEQVLAAVASLNNPTVTGIISADLSNATPSNRVRVRSNVSNGRTHFGATPNGAGTGAEFAVYSDSDPDNASVGQIEIIDGQYVAIRSSKTGSGIALPMRFYMDSLKAGEFDLEGRFGAPSAIPGYRGAFDAQDDGETGVIASGQTTGAGGVFFGGDAGDGAVGTAGHANGSGLRGRAYNGTVEAVLGYQNAYSFYGAGRLFNNGTIESQDRGAYRPGGHISRAVNGSALAAPSVPGTTSTAHGGTIVPDRVVAKLRCDVADLGHTVGSLVELASNSSQTVTTGGDATNMWVSYSRTGLPVINNKTTGAASAITAGRWALVLIGQWG